MAKVLAEGTGAEWAQVWLVVGDRPTLAATWPPEATPERAAGDPGARSRTRWRAAVPRRCGTAASVLGVLGRPGARAPPAHLGRGAPVRGAGRPGRSRAARGSAARRARAASAPSCRLAPTSCARRASGWSTLQDEERRLLERDIHDGAQQHLVALAVNLRLAQTLAAAGAGTRGRHPRRARCRQPSTPSTPWCTCPAASTRRLLAETRARRRAAPGGRQQPGPGAGRPARRGATRRDSGGGGLLLLPGGRAERGQALRRDR